MSSDVTCPSDWSNATAIYLLKNGGQSGCAGWGLFAPLAAALIADGALMATRPSRWIAYYGERKQRGEEERHLLARGDI